MVLSKKRKYLHIKELQGRFAAKPLTLLLTYTVEYASESN